MIKMASHIELSYLGHRMKTILAETSRVPFARQIEDIVMSTPVVDVHTHLYQPVFKDLLLWGIDDLLTYHYLVAEVFRYLDLPYDKFWSLSKPRQAELIWDYLFIQHSPISEACRGVLTTLHSLGLDVKKRDLPPYASGSPPKTLTITSTAAWSWPGCAKST